MTVGAVLPSEKLARGSSGESLYGLVSLGCECSFHLCEVFSGPLWSLVIVPALRVIPQRARISPTSVCVCVVVVVGGSSEPLVYNDLLLSEVQPFGTL